MYKRYLLIIAGIILLAPAVFSQSTAVVNPRPLTLEEYKKAKTFKIADLDKDTYVKFDNKYVLDRYEMRKPYLITGDDGLKKRIDLYKLYARDSMQEIGLVVYYTNEKNKLFTAVQPSVNSDPAVWEQYFEDIHAIDKEEKNFVLKLSYVLSREMSFQLYKALNRDAAPENATYGTEICFPGNQRVTMADGSEKKMQEIKPGDRVLTIDPVTHVSKSIVVKELTVHQPENYALTRLLLLIATTTEADQQITVTLSSKVVEATPNHPVQTTLAKKRIGDVKTGEQILCYDEKTKDFLAYTVYNKAETTGGKQKVYNIVAEDGETVVVNDVMVLQK